MKEEGLRAHKKGHLILDLDLREVREGGQQKREGREPSRLSSV